MDRIDSKWVTCYSSEFCDICDEVECCPLSNVLLANFLEPPKEYDFKKRGKEK